VIRRSIKVGVPAGPDDLHPYNTQKDIDSCLASIPEKGEGACTDFHSDLSREGDLENYVLITYQFFNKKFYSFHVSFPQHQYKRIETMLEGRYGRPHFTDVGKVGNAMGAKFNQYISGWRITRGTMFLYYPYGDTDHGLLIYEDPGVVSQIEAQEKMKLEKQGKSAF